MEFRGTFLGTLAATGTLGGVDGRTSTLDVGSAWKGFDGNDSTARRWWIIKLLQGDPKRLKIKSGRFVAMGGGCCHGMKSFCCGLKST